MRRAVFLGSVCLTLISLSGCHLCHKKHHKAAYAECDPCACTTSISGPAVAPVPLSYEAVSPAPQAAIAPALPKVLGAPQG
jgi:hypothetical protein